MKSTNEHEFYMLEALKEARLALAQDEVPVGAVLVKDNRIVVRTHNLQKQRTDPTAHAELLALSEAFQLYNGRLNGCTLYVTMEPCAMCAGAIVNAKLPKLVFGAFDARAGCCGSVLDLTHHALSFTVEVWGGVLEAECTALLSDFFQSLRKRREPCREEYESQSS